MKKSKMMTMSKKMKRQIVAFFAFVFLAGAGTLAWINNADAKTQTNTKLTPAERMAKYTYKGKGKQNAKENIRVSSLTQMNAVTEAANVLNTLPINIMKEMEKGKTLEQVAQEKGLSKDQFLKKMADYENQTVAVAVKAGEISEKHEKALKDGQKDRLNNDLKLKAQNVKDHQGMNMGQ